MRSAPAQRRQRGAAGERRDRVRSFLDPQRLVPFRHPLGPSERTDLELARVPANGKMDDRTSSVSPERADTIVAKPAVRPADSAANVSVTVPAWLGLMSTALHAPWLAAARTRAAFVVR